MKQNGNGKSRRKSPDPFNGAGLTPGNPGNSGGKPGRSGRLADEIRVVAREAITKHKLMAVAVTIARKAKRDGDRLAALKLLLAYGYGQPEQRIEHTGEDGGPIEFVTEARESFTGRMDRLTARLGASRISEFSE